MQSFSSFAGYRTHAGQQGLAVDRCRGLILWAAGNVEQAWHIKRVPFFHGGG